MKNINNTDNITTKPVKKPSKVKNIVKIIFLVNFKVLSYIINIVLTVLLIVIITGGIITGAFALYVTNYVDRSIDDLTTMSTSLEMTTRLYYYDDNGQEIEMDTLRGSQNRFWAKYTNMPKDLVHAFIAIEDKRFLEHNGVDWYRTIAAAGNFVNPTQNTFGGSTITQQLVKMMTGNDEQTIQRKLQEILRAMALESKSSKEDIMETYLNMVGLSNGCYGVQAAANSFFNKDVSQLTLIECAALAAIVKSPTKYDPVRNPEENAKRRNQVIWNMKDLGYITEEQFDEAFNHELVLNRPQGTAVDTIKSYYVDQVIEDVIADLMKKYPTYTRAMASHMIYSGGLKIYTCMDSTIQRIMEQVYNDDQYFPPQPEGAVKYQSAMVVLDRDGNLKGIVGGRGDKVQRGLNRASASARQPGSSIKPISVYAPALERGLINWGTPLNDGPVMKLNGKNWPPNYPAGYEGKISLSRAVMVSKNTTAVSLLLELTPEYVFRWLHDDLNITTLVDEEVTPSGKVFSDIGPGQLALGGMTYGVRVYELVGAYTMLANRGIYTKPRSYTKVKDAQGNTILDNRPEPKIMISEENAFIMTKLLMGVVEGGTAKYLPMKNKIQVAGKTGTTNDDKDRWFIGYTPYYLCGAWFGFDQPKYLTVSATSGNPPMLLFNYVMDKIHEVKGLYNNPATFEQPATVIEAPYCLDTGMAPAPGCRVAMGYFVKGLEPTELCSSRRPVAAAENGGESEGNQESVPAETETASENITDAQANTDNSVNTEITEPPTQPAQESVAEPTTTEEQTIGVEETETDPPQIEQDPTIAPDTTTANIGDIIGNIFSGINNDYEDETAAEVTIGAE